LLDIDGVRQAMLRGDGAGIATLDVSNDKAYTAMSTRTDTGVLVERAKTTPPSQIVLKEPHMLLAQGSTRSAPNSNRALDRLQRAGARQWKWKFTAEIDSPAEGTGFEPSVPLLRSKANSAIATKGRTRDATRG
jgi:hypothetical protein